MMNKIIVKSEHVGSLLFAVTLLFVFVSLSFSAFAAPDKAKGPKCQYRDLESNKIVSYDCDRFQSKGDIDSTTPQLKIVSPIPGQEIDYSTLTEIQTDTNGDGVNETYKVLPITIVISPATVYTVDFTAASSAGSEYAFLPQIDGLGHAHAYIGPAIQVAPLGNQDEDEEIEYDVSFVDPNRSDKVGGFCVFQTPVDDEDDYQLLRANCPLWQFEENIVNGNDYRVIVDTTENSHGPRIKNHPRDLPPGDQVIISFENVPE